MKVGRVTRATLGRAHGQMMLHAKTVEHGLAAVIAVDRTGNHNGTLGQQQAVALVFRDVEVIGDDGEIFARLVEEWAGVDVHGADFLLVVG